MVNKCHNNQFFVFEIIARTGVFVICFYSDCKVANLNNPEIFHIVAPNNNVCLRCVRCGQFCDLFFSESVCE